MSVNRDEALRAKDIAEGLMKRADFTAARKLAAKAQSMDSSLENISQMTMVCDVHCAATKLFANEMDWYGILQVELNADDINIKKQYKRLALLLHPDKNKLPGAESAFKLIGEAQRILLDKNQRMLHDIKRKTSTRPSPAPSYKPQQAPSYRTQHVNVNMRNVFNEFRPENRHPQQKPQAQPAAFTHRPTFWTACPFCRNNYEYGREHMLREVTCQACKKQFTAYEIPSQSVPMAKFSSQTTSSFPQQNKFPGQKSCNEPHKRPDGPATVSSGKASFHMPGSTAENSNGKRKRKYMDESSESSDSESSSDSEDELNDDTMAAGGLGSNGGQQPRRSVRSKRQVSYNENLSDDDVDLVKDIGEGSGKNVDTEKEEEPEEEKQTHEGHQSTENLPNGINPNEKVKERLDDLVDESSLGGEVEPNIFKYEDPEFSDFDKLREEGCFHVGQIWALYDEGEGMPRFYALIRKVTTQDFSVKYVWLEAEEVEEDETRSLPVSVGNYVLGDEGKTNSRALFSHLVRSKARINARKFKVFPGKGETWALFKNWNMDLSSDSDSPREYEFVEILSDHAEGATISVGFLSKVEGFKYVYSPMPKDEADTFEIPPHEFFRFSHRVPSFRLKGTEGRGVSEGWYEVDPAALPVPGSQNISEKEEAEAQDQDHQSPASGSAC